jgi:hypothetical protein
MRKLSSPITLYIYNPYSDTILQIFQVLAIRADASQFPTGMEDEA